MITLDQLRHLNMDQRLVVTEFAIEGDSFASMTHWRTWAIQAKSWCGREDEKQTRLNWLQVSDGWAPTIGHIDGRPVSVSLFWSLLDNRLVLYYYGSSQLVDHKMIEDWLRTKAPQLFHDPVRRMGDAMNSHIVMHSIQELNRKEQSNGDTKA